jgi:4a-hydroxytetrahydrobiopterin dehydratase
MTDMKIREFQEAAKDWRVVSDGGCAFFRTSSLSQAAAFVEALAQVPNLSEHRYGIDIRQAGVTVRVVTLRDDYFGMTDRDVELALAISAIAQQQGLASDPSRIQSMLIVPGAPNIKEVTPFWQAALGYVPRPDSVDEDMIDADDRLAAFWFETMDEPRPGGLGAIHVAVWLPSEEIARARVDAALAAGGTMVRDDFAPSWWTIADKYGNEMDIATVAYRDEPPPGWEPPTAEG